MVTNLRTEEVVHNWFRAPTLLIRNIQPITIFSSNRHFRNSFRRYCMAIRPIKLFVSHTKWLTIKKYLPSNTATPFLSSIPSTDKTLEAFRHNQKLKYRYIFSFTPDLPPKSLTFLLFATQLNSAEMWRHLFNTMNCGGVGVDRWWRTNTFATVECVEER